MLLVGVLLLFDYSIVTQIDSKLASGVQIMILVMAFLYALIFLYIYPVLAKFYNSIKNLLRNAILMAIRHLPYTAAMLVVCACPFAIFLIPDATVQATVILLLILFGPAVVAYVNSHFFVKIFDNYVPAEEDSAQKTTAKEEISENSMEASKVLTETVNSTSINGGDPV
jgi:uncharacterized membrane protein YesL